MKGVNYRQIASNTTARGSTLAKYCMSWCSTKAENNTLTEPAISFSPVDCRHDEGPGEIVHFSLRRSRVVDLVECERLLRRRQSNERGRGGGSVQASLQINPIATILFRRGHCFRAYLEIRAITQARRTQRSGTYSMPSVSFLPPPCTCKHIMYNGYGLLFRVSFTSQPICHIFADL